MKHNIETTASGVSLQDSKAIIKVDSEGLFRLYDVTGNELASSTSPKLLSKFAFAHGALGVRHEYDCGLEDN